MVKNLPAMQEPQETQVQSLGQEDPLEEGESAALNMPANLENSAVATGLEKVHFHSNS